jgi:hypothetical protein
MRHPVHDSRPRDWQVLSTYVRPRGGLRRLEQAFRLLLGSPCPPEAANPLGRRSDHACRDLRPRLDRPSGARPDD